MVLGSGILDPGSGGNAFRIPDPGVKKAPDPGSRIRIRNTGWQTNFLSVFRGWILDFFGPPVSISCTDIFVRIRILSSKSKKIKKNI
jgi:hypothetical protein